MIYSSTQKLFSLPLDQKLKLIEEIISIETLSDSVNFKEAVVNNSNFTIDEKCTYKNKYFLKKASFLLFALLLAIQSFAQTIDNVPIGEILAAMPAGITLRDGTLLRAEVISLGTASPPYADHGIYNQYEFGGVYNGFNDGALAPTGPDGNGLGAYSGDLNPLNFTRINATPRGDIDRGEISNFGNAIGFHFWADRPIIAKELLLIDCDGSNSSGNQEWFTIFGYNGTTAVNPAVSLSGSTELVQGIETVNTNWHTLVDAEIPGSVPSFTTKRIAKNTTSTTPAINDPDNRDYQALFDFGTNKVDHLFILWGIRNDLAGGGHATTGAQNSGVSPLVFSFDFDYGDAPNSYGTNKATNGPVHVVPAVPLLTLGSGVTTENNGIGSPLANSDIDDGIITIDSILRRPAVATDTIGSYSLTVSYTNITGSVANYVAWIDWNNNGSFQASEGKAESTAAGATAGTLTFTWTNVVMTNHVSTDHTYARIRVTTEAITTANDKNIPFQDGEVEDYYIPFSDSGSGPLPIKLLSFDAEQQNDRALLKWQVAEQKDVEKYEIHRSSNGIDYNNIGLVKAAQMQTQYSLWDINPNDGMNLYQLRTINLDGSYQIAPKTLNVTFKKNTFKLFFYPNPSEQTIGINTTGYNNGSILELMVYNTVGQVVIKKSLSCGLNNIDISNLQKGHYFFSLMDGSRKVLFEKIEINK